MRCANPIVTFLHLQVGDASAIVAGMPSPVARREPGARQTKTRRPNSSRRCHRLPTAKCIQSISLGQAAKLSARSLMSWRYGAGVIHVLRERVMLQSSSAKSGGSPPPKVDVGPSPTATPRGGAEKACWWREATPSWPSCPRDKKASLSA